MRSWIWIAGLPALCLLLCAAAVQAVAAEPAAKPAPAAAPSLPAVDGLNFKIAGFAGVADGSGTYGGSGSVSVPLGHRFGLQIDGDIGGVDTRDGGVLLAGAAVHLFWRDPRVGLAGFYGHYQHSGVADGVDTLAGGADLALYLGRFTIQGVVGIQAAEGHRSGPGRVDLDSRFFDVVRLSYYATDNLALTVGHSYLFGTNSALFGAEWGFPAGGSTMGAIFVNGDINQDGNAAVTAGLRFYFGRRPKPLIRRHREDDPEAYYTLMWLQAAAAMASYNGQTPPNVNLGNRTSWLNTLRNLFGINR